MLWLIWISRCRLYDRRMAFHVDVSRIANQIIMFLRVLRAGWTWATLPTVPHTGAGLSFKYKFLKCNLLFFINDSIRTPKFQLQFLISNISYLIPNSNASDNILLHVFFSDLMSTRYRTDIFQNWLSALGMITDIPYDYLNYYSFFDSFIWRFVGANYGIQHSDGLWVPLLPHI